MPSKASATIAKVASKVATKVKADAGKKSENAIGKTVNKVVVREIANVSDGLCRCGWIAASTNSLYVEYHDAEWGKPCHDETKLFEMLNLEGAQAGLSWETILNKRENYRIAFDNWNVDKICNYDATKFAELMNNAGIVRNKLKIAAVITNAKAYKVLCSEQQSLDHYLWSHVPNKSPIVSVNNERIITTPLSDLISKDLKKRGFKFVGSTIIYAYLQAIGIVNDHTLECAFRGVK